MVYRIKLFQRWKKDHAMKDKKRFEILLKVINRIYNENCEIHELIDASIIGVCTEEGVLPEQFFCVCVKRITHCNCLCFSSSSSCDFASVIRNIRKFGAKTANIRSFRSLKYTVIIRIRKNLSNLPFLYKRFKARTVC